MRKKRSKNRSVEPVFMLHFIQVLSVPYFTALKLKITDLNKGNVKKKLPSPKNEKQKHLKFLFILSRLASSRHIHASILICEIDINDYTSVGIFSFFTWLWKQKLQNKGRKKVWNQRTRLIHAWYFTYVNRSCKTDLHKLKKCWVIMYVLNMWLIMALIAWMNGSW